MTWSFDAWGTLPWATLPGVATLDRRAIVSWAEMETPEAPRRAIVTWAEIEIDDSRRAIVTWAETEVPDEPRRSLVTWAEMEVPDEARRSIVTWAEAEVPDEPRRSLVTWAEAEVPDEPRRSIVTWAELEAPELDLSRRAILTWAELEVPDLVSTFARKRRKAIFKGPLFTHWRRAVLAGDSSVVAEPVLVLRTSAGIQHHISLEAQPTLVTLVPFRTVLPGDSELRAQPKVRVPWLEALMTILEQEDEDATG